MMAAQDMVENPPLPWRELACHLQEHRRHALRIAASLLALALLTAALLPPRYRATATLAVLPSPEFTVRQPAGSHDLNASALAMDQIMKAETEILGSDDLHAATLRAVGPAVLYPAIFAPQEHGPIRRGLDRLVSLILSPWRVTQADPAAARAASGLRRFARDLNVLPAKDSNVITVTLDNADGAVAAAAVNAMLNLYAARRRRLYDDPQMDIVRREADAGERAADQADRALMAFKRSQGISDFDQQRSLLLQRCNQADQAMQDAQAAAAESRARLEALTRLVAAEPVNVGLFDEHDVDTRLATARAALSDLRAKLAAESEKYTPTSRLMTMLRSQIAAQETEATRLQRDPAASVIRLGRNPALDPLRLDRDHAAADLAATQGRVLARQAERQMLARTLDRLDAAEADLAALQRSRATKEENFRTASRILAERRLSETEDARRLANVRVIQPAAVPQFPGTLPLLVIIAGAIMAPVAALGWLIARYVLQPVFLTGEGLEAATRLPVLAVFGLQPGPVKDALLTD